MPKSIFMRDAEPKGSHSYVIDTNILMYLFSPIASYDEKKQERVSKFLELCKSVNSGIITTSMILGEFFHVNLRIYYDNWCSTQNDSQNFDIKRDYRPTADYKDSVEAINSSIQSILKLTSKFTDNFSSISVEDINKHCFYSEFTDSYILQLANDNGWLIVSNDKDLVNHPNRKYDIILLG